MVKISVPVNNDYCPQTLFLYGTYREDGVPNFGLFCWFSYCWADDLGVMACIGGSKLTLDRIRETRVFSANLVTEELLPLADYFGSADGRNPDKMNIAFAWEKGAVLNVPVLTKSPVAFELEVDQFIPTNDEDCVVLLCKIRNVLQDEALSDPSLSTADKLAKIVPISTTCSTYFGWDGRSMGAWHEPGKQIKSE